MKNLAQVWVGVDVSKDHLDIHIYPINKGFRVENNDKGIKSLIRKLKQFSVQRVGFESSGGYEFLLKDLLKKAKNSCWIIDPRRIRSFRASEGIKVKTDPTDAKMIAAFVAVKTPAYTNFELPEEQDELKALVRRKKDVTEAIAKEKKRLKHPQQRHCIDEIESSIAFHEQQIKKLESRIDALLNAHDEWKQKYSIIESIPGVGKTTATALIAHMPELGRIEGKQAAALLGVAPYNNQSGKFIGKAFIRDGRSLPRHSLYMAALTASRSNPVLSKFYKRLIDDGKKPKVALVAIMRKLIVMINAMLKTMENWRVA